MRGGGSERSSKIVAPVNPDLARASIEAVSKWRYSTTLLNGQPIEVDTNITINFTLKP